MRLLILLLVTLLSNPCTAQFKLTTLDKNSLPKTVSYTGKIVTAVKWKDASGDNIVILTETGQTASKASEYDNMDAALYAYHYLLQSDSVSLTWKVHDFIKDCPVDLKASFSKNTFAVTDLDKNGKAEIWLMYKTACHGDVSPANMKIIMYHDDKKYAVRGTNKVKISDKEQMGGQYTFDEAFKTGPIAFRKYAAALWQKNILETWD